MKGAETIDLLEGFALSATEDEPKDVPEPVVPEVDEEILALCEKVKNGEVDTKTLDEATLFQVFNVLHQEELDLEEAEKLLAEIHDLQSEIEQLEKELGGASSSNSSEGSESSC